MALAVHFAGASGLLGCVCREPARLLSATETISAIAVGNCVLTLPVLSNGAVKSDLPPARGESVQEGGDLLANRSSPF